MGTITGEQIWNGIEFSLRPRLSKTLFVPHDDHISETDRLKSLLQQADKRMTHSVGCIAVRNSNCKFWTKKHGCETCGGYKNGTCLTCTCGLDDLRKQIAEVVG